jgi:hypothetical protein
MVREVESTRLPARSAGDWSAWLSPCAVATKTKGQNTMARHTFMVAPSRTPEADGELRDTLLERDPLYPVNARQLYQRAASRKIEPRQAANIQHWLVLAALRRAGVTRYRAILLASA